MSDLVSFGCSLTYGHGLPDCFTEPYGHGPNPSNLAWPKLLADKLNKTCINKSYPGSSNIQILWQILNYQFHKNDICVVYWSYFLRYAFSRLKKDHTFRYVIDLDSKQLSNKITLDELDQENLAVRNFICMSHAKLFLNAKGIKCIFLAHEDMYNYKVSTPECLELNIYPYGEKALWEVDKALDKKHPGVRSHEKLANLIYNSNVLY